MLDVFFCDFSVGPGATQGEQVNTSLESDLLRDRSDFKRTALAFVLEDILFNDAPTRPRPTQTAKRNLQFFTPFAGPR